MVITQDTAISSQQEPTYVDGAGTLRILSGPKSYPVQKSIFSVFPRFYNPAPSSVYRNSNHPAV